MEGDLKETSWAVEYPDGGWHEMSARVNGYGFPTISFGAAYGTRQELELVLAARGMRIGVQYGAGTDAKTWTLERL